MIEKFENRKLDGMFAVKCKFDDGTIRIWAANKAVVVEQIRSIVEDYLEQGYKLTLRQLHYQMVGANYIVNHITAYKKLGDILDDCRYGGIIDWDAIVDRGRIPKIDYWVKGIEDALSDTISQYKLNRQEGQRVHIELWTEKDALSEIMSRPASKYHINLVINKGYTSSSAIYDAYQRFSNYILNDRKVIILYFGDHDPSGLDMIRDIRERLTFMFKNGENQFEIDESIFEVVPIGLTMAQIKKYKLPPNPAKTTDSRLAGYTEKFGNESWEVDALTPQVFVRTIESNIEKRIDMDMFDEMVERENEQLAILKKFVKKFED